MQQAVQRVVAVLIDQRRDMPVDGLDRVGGRIDEVGWVEALQVRRAAVDFLDIELGRTLEGLSSARDLNQLTRLGRHVVVVGPDAHLDGAGLVAHLAGEVGLAGGGLSNLGRLQKQRAVPVVSNF